MARPRDVEFNFCVRVRDIVVMALVYPCQDCGRTTMRRGAMSRFRSELKDGLKSQGLTTRSSHGLCDRCGSRSRRNSKVRGENKGLYEIRS